MDKAEFNEYMKIFLEKNSKLNLISKNDEKFLWEKHILDSLSFEKFLDKYNIKNLEGKKLLDIGTGGGFPSVPLAIKYPDMEVYALDSIGKKINAISEIKETLSINNLNPICERAENLNNIKVDFITSRAVAALKILIPYAIPLLKNNGYFVAYKSRKAQQEIEEARDIIKKYNAKISDIINYNISAEDTYERNLVIIQKINHS